MNPAGFLAVGVGAALGAWIRWWLGVRLNPLFLQLPLGTLVANLLGGYLIGVAVAYFAHHTALPPEVRWFLVTGFLGALTTFSTFSAEVVMMISAAQYGWALATAGLHLVGSLLMTGLGIVTFQWLRA
ncbi:fluoride efflux transporter CrcB [Denitromonas ohlonensis]|uniref:Fluoride-specific ion channel FluC n=2 Tax=Denitromonas TaxID=139331 RepID=A0A558EMD4_9RHOO|nr:fluoride efflux transporter CrcB [Denitromonas ohlonensis]TVT49348.1 MAG: fluoride efflux transporter CrcB [Denitromonas halophila]TVO62712.1 fluoride efflux transporter CrcB [Denitromonas ohlonensis]TVO78917.1 fluoride efflux transporter CrcB [Denitromonas ohlonensis]TVT74554.1 MAG: fluoride efflux transporter CrcB [Denitromonas halophila]TVT75112.1 MAG: fluoride efflux transporter CrcB [Denitromonas halophila]